MWLKALRTVPKVSKEKWKELGIITRWLIAVRGGVLILTFLSACISGLFAIRDSKFDGVLWLILTLGLLFAHATNNLLNDYVDWTKGVDEGNYFRVRYGTHPMTVMTKRELEVYILATGLIALCFAIYLVYLRGTIVLYLTLAGSFFLLFYTYPLKYIGLGEISVFLVWGILMIGGGYYTITEEWNWQVCWASIPYALGPTVVIFGKHIDKLDADKAKAIYSLPVILGDALARRFAQMLLILQYLSILFLVYIKFFTPILFIVIGAIPHLIRTLKIYNHPKPLQEPKDYPKNIWPLYYVAYAFLHNTYFGSLFVLGMLLDLFYQKYL
jgi:1,4-dihydroxy-2-naphthoate octaprenyltransferase